MKRAIWLSALAFVLAFAVILAWKIGPELTRPKYIDPAFRMLSPLELASIPTATHFDFPLGNENGAMAYNAQRFTENKHLGDDLNGIGGENSDLGDPIYAIADGRDVSWIWDVDFEPLIPGLTRLVATGDRAAELALRFKYGGLDAAAIDVLPSLEAALDRGLELTPPGGELVVLPTYTAMLALRRIVGDRGFVRPYWESAA